MIQVMLYDTLNCFFVSDQGALLQKLFAPTQPGADNNGWVSHELAPAGSCQAGIDVDRIATRVTLRQSGGPST